MQRIQMVLVYYTTESKEHIVVKGIQSCAGLLPSHPVDAPGSQVILCNLYI